MPLWSRVLHSTQLISTEKPGANLKNEIRIPEFSQQTRRMDLSKSTRFVSVSHFACARVQRGWLQNPGKVTSYLGGWGLVCPSLPKEKSQGNRKTLCYLGNRKNSFKKILINVIYSRCLYFTQNPSKSECFPDIQYAEYWYMTDLIRIGSG